MTAVCRCRLYLLTVIWYSITHSLFLSRLKTFLLYKSFPAVGLPFFLLKYLLHGFPGLFTVISDGHICFLLLVFFPVFKNTF